MIFWFNSVSKSDYYGQFIIYSYEDYSFIFVILSDIFFFYRFIQCFVVNMFQEFVIIDLYMMIIDNIRNILFFVKFKVFYFWKVGGL